MTDFNLSTETCVFAFLGLSIFSFPRKFEISCDLVHIAGVTGVCSESLPPFFPHQHLQGSQDHTQHDVHHVVQWIVSCNPLCPEPPFESGATIVIMLLTILLLVGSTMYLIRLIDIDDCKSSHKYKKDINLSKMEKVGNTIESEHLSELTEEEYDAP
ncbi:sodium/hydrogen exchanger 8-like isoform X2 [Polyodon spathula]|uniref:sodium/hydrogen exchanger 8-like isoform X2 n=1 Tax=Polyodon spathula TaxID=7913 RepID=UPI001B7E7D3A|nr:sodium/hydrogen exchanger 8-like isoform X2 [Polyodon spathula]